ncbi:hypothetical protein OIDMADRAFT_148367 [Oidiodendron maius Zn]|uniref:Secreted protein n=1 Tax=Oidiodendron maius (strain Zn) TaxID=913774 RepID=A0A0C3H205_OIDMZ|nr:hypothetical protein OIDMADRAFT_148367 [Oidiodendron maius Zn]
MRLASRILCLLVTSILVACFNSPSRRWPRCRTLHRNQSSRGQCHLELSIVLVRRTYNRDFIAINLSHHRDNTY